MQKKGGKMLEKRDEEEKTSPRENPLINPPRPRTEHKIRRRIILTAVGIATGAASIGIGWLRSRHPSNVTATPPLQPTPIFRLSHTDYVTSVAWSPDSTRLVSGSYDTTVKVWDALKGTLIIIYQGPEGHTDVVTCVSWSPDGKYIASGSWDATIKVWDVSAGKLHTTYQSGAKAVNAVGWSYDSKYIASGSSEPKNILRAVKIWNIMTGQEILQYANDYYNIHAVAWTLNTNDLIATGTDYNRVYLQDFKKNTTMLIYADCLDDVNTLAWAPLSLDKFYIASGSGPYDPTSSLSDNNVGDTTVRIWDASTGQTIFVYKGHPRSVLSLSWSPNGKYIASGGADKTVQVWVPFTGQLIARYTAHANDVEAVAWSPDGQYIASGSFDHTVHIWQMHD